MFFLSSCCCCSAIRVRRGGRLECKLRSSGQERQTWRVVVKNRGLCPLPYRLAPHRRRPLSSFMFSLDHPGRRGCRSRTAGRCRAGCRVVIYDWRSIPFFFCARQPENIRVLHRRMYLPLHKAASRNCESLARSGQGTERNQGDERK